MHSLPTGTVTFLFTDIEGSTRLLQQLGDRYAQVLTGYRRLLHAAIQEHGGQEVDNQGDACFIAFSRARDALMATVAAQRAILSNPWPDGTSVRVRMGLHTGEPVSADTEYVGMDLHRAARICDAGHGGQVLLSEATRILVVEDLPGGVSLRDLGEHRLKDLARPQHLFQVVVADLPVDFPPLRSLEAHPHNFPIQLTSFIGREREIAKIKEVLSTCRLVSITGVGGAGKTRLALQAAAEVLEEFKDGVWVVELAALADSALVPQAVASALRVQEQPGRPLTETLAEHLRSREMLLVVDNCEHLLSACAQLTEAFLRSCRGIKILATSREGLGITGETLYPIPSLSLPKPRQLPPLEDLTSYEAVRLFTDRATAVQPTFKVTLQNAKAVVDVCQRLDGLPLAIELAAARIKVLAVDQIAARLDDRFRLLTGGSRTVLPRHQTLSATLNWSYDLLSDDERAVLRRLSVFAGGWTLEAAEAVCAGNGVESGDVLDSLTRLVDRSLVVAETQAGEARYQLLETVRQFGRDKLLESCESAGVRTRHLEWYEGFVERARLRGPDYATWLDRLEAEHDNLRAALEWSLGGDAAEAGLRLSGTLADFWWTRGYASEGRRWLEAALAANAGAQPEVRTRALMAAGNLAREQGDYGRAATLYEQGMSLYKEQGSERGIAFALNSMGRLAWRQSDYKQARVLLEESLALRRKLGDQRDIADTLNALGNVAHAQDQYGRAIALHEESLVLWRSMNSKSGMAGALGSLGNALTARGEFERAAPVHEESLSLFRSVGYKAGIAVALHSLGTIALSLGDYKRAKTFYEESLTMRREQGNKRGLAWVLSKLGIVAQSLGDYGQATTLHEESLALFREIGERRGIASSLHNLGTVACALGEDDRAAALHKESLAFYREAGLKSGIAPCLEGLAQISARQRPERAARLLGAAEGLRETIAFPLPPVVRREYDSMVAAVGDRLGEEAFTAAWAEGRAMKLEQVVEYALMDTA